LHRSLTLIREAGCRVGVAINPHTPAVMLQEVIPMLDIINVMTVDPGFGGQSFLSGMVSKIKQLRAMADAAGRSIDIEVDGGINTKTASTAVEAGANVLIAGTTIFRHKESVQAGIDELRGSVPA
jgi:ribulose-phosphate 3-epimerase